jgi:hypothetical protein
MNTVKLPKTSAIGLNISGFFGNAVTLLHVFWGRTAFENIGRIIAADELRYSAGFVRISLNPRTRRTQMWNHRSNRCSAILYRLRL